MSQRERGQLAITPLHVVGEFHTPPLEVSILRHRCASDELRFTKERYVHSGPRSVGQVEGPAHCPGGTALGRIPNRIARNLDLGGRDSS